ncbi:MAG: glycosyltransferase [Candidatus Omnitrophica bacterium]|nr:glycosyltransferase [Candidatus Omnitrophota bacterium]MDD5352466.1 glycosyltransferase [Candidatus Omnitrophota bacterium]MDD5550064.1 glycosyltransferase [Candidatus Omnitrophota bacterium]
MMDIKEKISVIMPAFNEAEVIERNILETIDTFKRFNLDFEIIVIDDGSTDDTLQKIKNISEKFTNVKVTRNMENYGKGRALKKGFRLATGQYVVFLDSDIDLHPAQIETFFDIMKLDNADIVIGSKRHPNSVLNYPLQRKIISSVYFFLIKIMFGLPIKDTQTGLKLFKYEVLKRVFPKIVVKAFAFDLEVLVNAHRLGYKIAEAPVIIDSKREFNRIGIYEIIEMWVDTMAIFYRMYILKYYDKIG